jgi:RHS repeat-associated protein
VAGSSALGGPAPYWKSYETDAIGNRVSEINHDTGLDAAKNITRSYEYGGAGALGDGPHQVTKVTEKTPTGDRQSTYEYDDAGDTTKRTLGGNAQVLAWDDSGALTKVTEAGGSQTSYLYDASGNRVQRKDPSGTTVYLPGTELKLSADGTKTEATRYYEYAGQTVAVRTAAKVSFIAADHHGTGELAIDSATGAISQRRYDPFGVERGEKTGTWPGEKGYVGGTIDASTGLTHLGAREYDAVIGKFISVDPVIDYTQPQQINGYAYANNSPVTHADPSGMIVPECREGLIECRGGIPVTNTDPEVSKAQSDVSKASGDVAAAQQQQASARQRIKSAGKALVKIARDILGVDAALDCISTGDVGSCGETLLNIAGSFAGGLAGKILAKYGAPWKWAKGIKLAKRVTGLVGDLIGGVKGLWKANKAVGRAKLGLSKAAEKLAEVRKKAAAAAKKNKATDEADADSLLRQGGGRAGGAKRLPMTMECVCRVAEKYGIEISDLNIRIDKAKAGFYGSTAPNHRVTLTRDAFRSEEQLARTLVHERKHVEDLRNGAPYPPDYDAGNIWETEARAFENDWWDNVGKALE